MILDIFSIPFAQRIGNDYKSDKKNKIAHMDLSDILEEIENGNLFNWSILYLYAAGHLGEGKSIPVLEEQIINSEKGLFISWNELKLLSSKLYNIIDITLVASSDKSLLRRYFSDKEMYNNFDIVIEMIDSSYWEVFSKDIQLINKISNKFKLIEFLDPDFEK